MSNGTQEPPFYLLQEISSSSDRSRFTQEADDGWLLLENQTVVTTAWTERDPLTSGAWTEREEL